MKRSLSAPPGARKDLFWELVAALVRHEVAEEVVVYPTIRSEAPDGEAEVEPRLKEQQQAQEMLASMEDLDPESDEFGQKLSQLRDDVLEHAQAEEQNIFRSSGLSSTRKSERNSGRADEKAKASAPTDPHPNAPDTPPGNRSSVPSLPSQTRSATR